MLTTKQGQTERNGSFMIASMTFWGTDLQPVHQLSSTHLIQLLPQPAAGEDAIEDSDQEDDSGVGGESASAQVEGRDTEGTSRSGGSRSSTPVSIKRKKKRSKGEVVEDVMSKVMKSITEGLKERDKMFLDMEENRMNNKREKSGNFNCR